MHKRNHKKLERLFKKYNVEIDLYDIQANWDNKISPEENFSKIESDLKVLSESKESNKQKVDLRAEKEEIDRIRLQQLNEEITNTQEEFKQSLEKLQESNTLLEKLYWLPKKYIEAVVSKTNELYGLIFTGQAGVSKSFSTIQTLNELKTNYTYFAGYTTPLGLYEFLYNNKEGKTIVFDDTFGILNNPTSIMIMLNALYSSNGSRKISWCSTKLKDLPPEFILESNIILITNEIPKNIGSDLINSRCLYYRFDFNNFEILSIMKAIAELKHPKLTRDERNEIIKFIEENTDEATINFDLRVQNKIENLYLFSKDNWKDLSMPLLETKNEKLTLLKEFIRSSTTLQEAKKKWNEATGLGERSFQRYNLKLKDAIKNHATIRQ